MFTCDFFYDETAGPVFTVEQRYDEKKKRNSSGSVAHVSRPPSALSFPVSRALEGSRS